MVHVTWGREVSFGLDGGKVPNKFFKLGVTVEAGTLILLLNVLVQGLHCIL